MITKKYVVVCDVCGKEEEFYAEPIGSIYKKLKLNISRDAWSSDEKQNEEVEIDICNECIRKYFGELKEKALMKKDKCYEINKHLYKDIKSMELKSE